MKNEIKQNLLSMADENYKEFHSKLCPGTNNIIGVRVPVLRSYAKKLYKENNWKDIINEIDTQYYEEIMLRGMILGLVNSENIDIVLKYVENYIPYIDNWAICDNFCAGLKITKKNKEKMWNFIEKYLNSNKEFELRFAIVMILDYYIEDEYLERVFQIFENIKNDGYYVKMAIAWAISICLIKYYDQTIEYIKQTNIDKWTYNKAIQKAIESFRISDENKEYLRSLKK